MSPVIQDSEGVVIISRVTPQNDQRNGREEEQSHDAPATIPKPLAAFYRGEPEVLGTTQIFAGLFLICIGILLSIVASKGMYFPGVMIISGIPIWSGILYIISGSLSVAGSVKPTVGKVKSSLVMNIFSSLAAVCGMILVLIDVCIGTIYYSGFRRGAFCAYYQSDTQCLGEFNPMVVFMGLLVFSLLVFTLMFCITISTSVFACSTVCRSSFHEMSVIIYQTTSLNVSDTTRDVPPDSTAALTSDLKTQT